jgi:predicted transcriptional regulator
VRGYAVEGGKGMSNAVMISIRPKWCEKICNGEKTIEVRKTRPKLETPFKCYIYCTQARERLITILKDGDENYGEIYRGKPVFIKTDEGSVCDMWGKRQKVIGEFVCDRIFPIDVYDNGCIKDWNFECMWKSCLPYEGIAAYIGREKRGYGWHISNLKIYDTPKELSRFSRPFENCIDKVCDEFGCASCENGGYIKRPPQSWCYVEEQK